MPELLKIEYPSSKMFFQRYSENIGDEIRVFGKCAGELQIFNESNIVAEKYSNKL